MKPLRPLWLTDSLSIAATAHARNVTVAAAAEICDQANEVAPLRRKTIPGN